MLQKFHLENCLSQYLSRSRSLSDGFYLGYMEACLVQFGVIESKSNGLSDYVKKTEKKFLFWKWEVREGRASIIIRLVEEYLNT